LDCGSNVAPSSTVCTGVVVPSVAAVAPTSTAPAPNSEHCVSAPPTNTGVPAASPVTAAAAGVMLPTRSPERRTGARICRGMSKVDRISSDQQRPFRSKSIDSVALDGSADSSPLSR
jgi:hypothetical protein